jgi:hypothetical protein
VKSHSSAPTTSSAISRPPRSSIVALKASRCVLP